MPFYTSDDEISMASSFSDFDDATRVTEGGHSVASTVFSTVHTVDPVKIEAVEKRKKKRGDVEKAGEKAKQMIAEKENQMVVMSKIGVVVVLIMFTFIFSVATYSVTSAQQTRNLEDRFEEYANQIVDISVLNIEHVYQTYKALATQLTAYEIGLQKQQGSSNPPPEELEEINPNTWPYVTLPGFEAQTDIAIANTHARFVSIHPLVQPSIRKEWELYTQRTVQDWVSEGFQQLNIEYNETLFPITPFIFDSVATPLKERTPSSGAFFSGQYAPLWQVAPIIGNTGLINYDIFAFDYFSKAFGIMEESLGEAILSEVVNLNINTTFPESFMAIPIMNTLKDPISNGDTAKMVGIVTAFLPWHEFFTGILPRSVNGIEIVIRNSCGQTFTFVTRKGDVELWGEGDPHEILLEDYEVMANFTSPIITSIEECSFSLSIYPSKEFMESYESVGPIVYTGCVIFVFVLTALVFILYDWLVQRRQDKVLSSATRSNLLVSSLFPDAVKDRLMADLEAADAARKAADDEKSVGSRKGGDKGGSGGYGVADANTAGISREEILNTRPIADLFPDCTVMFADIVGFTAWSSEREPPEVFTLLEFVYNSFDKIARRLRVFKVETIGDCYVAVVGLPDTREDHALVMARFARACMSTMTEVVHTLELRLGPGTSDLCMRFGLHSGPVTAGVLRGDKSRFQLFGDTVNTAARMESSGTKNRIHISGTTMEQLQFFNKGHWIKARESTVSLKGKGEMQTYWLKTGVSSNSDDPTSATDSESEGSIDGGEHTLTFKSPHRVNESQRRLVVWNVEILQKLLKKIVAMRGEEMLEGPEGEYEPQLKHRNKKGETVLDEVTDIITLPSKASKYKQDPSTIELDQNVVVQLTSFVTTIASMYHENPFHSFYHASHVTQSVIKLLSRIVSDESIDYGDMTYNVESDFEMKHDFTFGLTSDPLTQFAVAFSALVHDVDHPGVPNQTLVDEGQEVAKQYNFKSVAEQNSVDLAWHLLMEPQYSALRACIYTNQTELNRFRQLVVNSVMATDVMDKELGQIRKDRWAKAFHQLDDVPPEEQSVLSTQADVNRKATIVIEHLIQASDVAHTMQHWNVYIKWNEKLFNELHKAFRTGRSDKDPSEGWYEGEIGFFDFYVIPLAMKLKECGVFGVSSDEYLNYAKTNREEWKAKGQDIVKTYVMKLEREEKHTAIKKERRASQINLTGELDRAAIAAATAAQESAPPVRSSKGPDDIPRSIGADAEDQMKMSPPASPVQDAEERMSQKSLPPVSPPRSGRRKDRRPRSRSRSPPSRNRSRSPALSDRSRSPPSRKSRNRSRSPALSDRSRSPPSRKSRNRSRSPALSDRSRSPPSRNRSRSRSPPSRHEKPRSRRTAGGPPKTKPRGPKPATPPPPPPPPALDDLGIDMESIESYSMT